LPETFTVLIHNWRLSENLLSISAKTQVTSKGILAQADVFASLISTTGLINTATAVTTAVGGQEIFIALTRTQTDTLAIAAASHARTP
jgi:hypothetical protein